MSARRMNTFVIIMAVTQMRTVLTLKGLLTAPVIRDIPETVSLVLVRNSFFSIVIIHYIPRLLSNSLKFSSLVQLHSFVPFNNFASHIKSIEISFDEICSIYLFDCKCH